MKIILLMLWLATLLCATVNVNRANSAQLQTLNGIGPAKAQEIIHYRKAHGNFKSIDELVNVKGIGPKTVEKMRTQVSVH